MASSQSWWSGPGDAPSPGAPAAPHPPPSSTANPSLEVPEPDPEQLVSRRIHILGVGSIGLLIAHSLRVLPNPPPMTLMMHRPEIYEDFKKHGNIIRLKNEQVDVNDEQSGFDADLREVDPDTGNIVWRFKADWVPGHGATNPRTKAEVMDSGETYIHSLIVTVKAQNSVIALREIKHRVNAKTTICLMQNGMGQIEALNREVFTDPETRPTYLLGIISHGVYRTGPFIVRHAGFGTVALGIYRDPDRFPLPPKNSSVDIQDLPEDERRQLYPTDIELYENISSRFLLRTLTRSTVLACAPFPYLDLLQLQLEKLSVNAVLNPLTALLNVPNGDMLYNNHLSKVHRLLIAEISLVFRGLPELDGLPNVKHRFSPERLEQRFISVSSKTARNSSSMREDVRSGNQTEIDYINGYIVKRGEEQGLKCVLNFMLLELIKGKTLALKKAEGAGLPYGVPQVEGQHIPGQAVVLEDKSTPGRGDSQ